MEKKFLEGRFAGDIDAGELRTPLIFAAVEQIVLTHAGAEKVAGAMHGGLWRR
jgi:hypothetical protein